MKDKLRMIQWLLIALTLYGLALGLAALHNGELPPVWVPLETAAWKLGNVTVAAFVGYWIDRQAFRSRFNENSSPLEGIRRGLVMAAAMLAVALGL